MEKEYKGYNGIIVLKDNAIVIKRGKRGFLLGGGMLRGEKTIPISSIVAVQLKKAGFTAGYIQFTLKGGSEAKGGLFESTRDENSIHFHRRKNNNEEFEELKNRIEEKIDQLSNGGSSKSSIYDELEKIASLKDKGILSEEEFQEQKKKLLNQDAK